MQTKQLINITKNTFNKYGVVIATIPTKNDQVFTVLISEKNAGWRIAVFEITRRHTKVLENHPLSNESFEPLSGTTLLVVAENSEPENFEVFLLDQPVCLYKGVWHQVVTLSEYSQIKITENLEVTSEFYTFEEEIRPLVIY